MGQLRERRWQLAILLFVGTARADLPVHCLHAQIAGNWIFYLGRRSPDNSTDRVPSCGAHAPGTKEDAMADPASVVGLDVTAYELSLEAPDVARDRAGNVGFWTMVYDEGFEVRLGGRVFFAFSRFHTSRAARDNAPIAPKDTAGYASECARTAPGWYHEPNASAWGCYYGVKAEAAAADASVVEAPAAEAPAAAAAAPTRQTAPPAMREISAQLWADDAPLAPPPAAAAIFLQQRGGAPNASAAAPRAPRRRLARMHRRMVELLNARPAAAANRSWAARLAPGFERLSLLEISAMSGGRLANRAAAVAGGGGAAGAAAGGGSELLRADDHGARGKYEGLPTHWDWRNVDGVNYVSRVRTQGSCGACYAIAAVGMVEARVRVASRNTLRPELSAQDVVSCSPFSQGCDGGFPYLVGKYLAEYGVVDDACFPYAKKVPCARRCAAPGARWRARNYRYVGGRYGGCGELAMMREIYENGPVVAGFEAGADLFYYGDGIYSQAVDAAFVELQGASAADAAGRAAAAQLRAWEHTNHAVLAVGWGVDPATRRKYWIAQNTWGPQWGERGFFRIARGADESAFESMAVAADVLLPPGVQPQPHPRAADAPATARRGGRRKRRGGRRKQHALLPQPQPHP